MHVDNEFHIFSYLGNDLPGVLIAEPMEPEEVPESVLTTHDKAKAMKFNKMAQGNKFSLAGVQMKFSMKEKEGVIIYQRGIFWVIGSLKHLQLSIKMYH